MDICVEFYISGLFQSSRVLIVKQQMYGKQIMTDFLIGGIFHCRTFLLPPLSLLRSSTGRCDVGAYRTGDRRGHRPWSGGHIVRHADSAPFPAIRMAPLVLQCHGSCTTNVVCSFRNFQFSPSVAQYNTYRPVNKVESIIRHVLLGLMIMIVARH